MIPPHQVSCPYCEAPAGNWCKAPVTLKGVDGLVSELSFYHAARIDAAAAASTIPRPDGDHAQELKDLQSRHVILAEAYKDACDELKRVRARDALYRRRLEAVAVLCQEISENPRQQLQALSVLCGEPVPDDQGKVGHGG